MPAPPPVDHGEGEVKALRVIRPLDAAVGQLFPDNTSINSRYTPYNFVFKNLYEQFRRPINLYFLLVTLLQFISVIAPVSPMSTLLPLLFAFSTTAAKEGYDDVKRHRQDTAYNNTKRTYLDVHTRQWRTKDNKNIRVGDVLRIRQDEDIPCDVVAIAASGKNVYVRTDNLDGEIDLKTKNIVTPPLRMSDCAHQRTGSTDAVAGFMSFFNVTDDPSELIEKLGKVELQCPPPVAMVETFDARAEFDFGDLANTGRRAAAESSFAASFRDDTMSQMQVSLTHSHLLPQSCLLKNTKEVIAIAVYTGPDTKVGMNKLPRPSKWAKIDQVVNRYSMIIFACQITISIVFGIIGYNWNRSAKESYWYLPEPRREKGLSFMIYTLRFFLLTTVMIPISFKFIVDMSKHYMTQTVEWDESMKHNGPNEPGCKVKDSSILEDLGQIDYVLSDKTGTLTQNVMELLYVSLGGRNEIALSDLEFPQSVTASPTCLTPQRSMTMAHGSITALSRSPSRIASPMGSMTKRPGTCTVTHFATLLALCNTVEVVGPLPPPSRAADGGGGSGNTGPAMAEPLETVEYRAASPDEVALCLGAAKLGVRLVHRDERLVTVESGGRREEWRQHYTFPFTSDRKTMGVIMEEMRTHRIVMVLKGADDRVLTMSRSRMPDPEIVEQLASYARQGLRTLLVAEKELSKEELQRFKAAAVEAELDLEARQEKMNALRTSMECGLIIRGITAIEDKLQEDVCETICDLHEAGVHVWMLTGDKVETAEQIGRSCALFTSEDRIIRIVDEGPRDGDGGSREGTSWEQQLLHMELPPLPHNEASLAPEAMDQLLQEMVDHVRQYQVVSETAGTFPQVTPLSSGTQQPDEEEEDDESGSPKAPASSKPQRHQPRTALVVQGGPVLQKIIDTPALAEKFFAVGQRCCSVICARVTPAQKAAVTAAVRSKGFMTLAIGDGGNDVAMIQEAHVGVGITGKEGQQAARAADFSISRFSDLRTLMFVHGQQAFVRTAYVIKYSFYKSMLIAFIQLAFNLFATRCSGRSFWSSFSLTLWNGVYTLPQTLFYCLDRFAPRVVLERTPKLYILTRRSCDIHPRGFFCGYVLRGILQSLMMLVLATAIYGTSFASPHTGFAGTHDVAFSVAYTAMILSQFLTVLLESHSLTRWNLVWLAGMPVFYGLSTWAFSSIAQTSYYGVFAQSLCWPSLLVSVAIAVALVLPFTLIAAAKTLFRPSVRGIVRHAEVRRQQALLAASPAYRRSQCFWVRWLGFVPEAPSSYVDNIRSFVVSEDVVIV